MALTTAVPCPKCAVSVLPLNLEGSPFPKVLVTAAPDANGHVVETTADNGRALKSDRSDAGGATVYQAHHLTCTG